MIYNKKLSKNEKLILTGNEINKLNLLKKLSGAQLDMKLYIRKNGLTILNMLECHWACKTSQQRAC